MTRLCNSARTHRVPFPGLSGTGLPVPLFPKSKNTPAPPRSTLQSQHVCALRNRAELHLGQRRPTARVEGPPARAGAEPEDREARTPGQGRRDPQAPGRGRPENPSPQHAHPSSRVNPGEVRGADSRVREKRIQGTRKSAQGGRGKSLGNGMRLVGRAGC